MLSEQEAQRRFSAARVARLATVGDDGRPHLVPIVFAVDPAGGVLYSAVDAKPKRHTALRRLANVRANPAVAVLADAYSEDWSALWWVRVDGAGRVLDPHSSADADEVVAARSLLAEKYEQYRANPPAGPVLAVDVLRWSGWSAAG